MESHGLPHRGVVRDGVAWHLAWVLLLYSCYDTIDTRSPRLLPCCCAHRLFEVFGLFFSTEQFVGGGASRAESGAISTGLSHRWDPLAHDVARKPSEHVIKVYSFRVVDSCLQHYGSSREASTGEESKFLRSRFKNPDPIPKPPPQALQNSTLLLHQHPTSWSCASHQGRYGGLHGHGCAHGFDHVQHGLLRAAVFCTHRP